jgi:hypothetical protein
MNNNSYNLVETTILINYQILPQTESENRTVLVTVGIKNEVPLGKTLTLEQLQLPSVITEMLGELERELPSRQIANEQRQKAEKTQGKKQDYQSRQVKTPQTPTASIIPQNAPTNKQQLALF